MTIQIAQDGSPSKLKARTFRVTFRLPANEQTSKTKASKPVRLYRNLVALAQGWQEMQISGSYSSLAALARQLGVSRARVTQGLQLLNLVPEVISTITALGNPLPAPIITERSLRPILKLPAEEQIREIGRILADSAKGWCEESDASS